MARMRLRVWFVGTASLLLISGGSAETPEEPSVLAFALADEWNSACLADYQSRVSKLKPLLPETPEPKRPEIRQQREPAEAALIVSDTPFDSAVIEGMSGRFSPRAISEREGVRRSNRYRNGQMKYADAELEKCLAKTPFFKGRDACPSAFSEDIDEASSGKICVAKQPGPPTAMSADRAYRGTYLRPIRVAFNGGSPAIRREIRDVALSWADQTNEITKGQRPDRGLFDPYMIRGALNFDFGTDGSDGFIFHTWTHQDKTYAADIRISFEDGLGFWSMIGTDSTKPILSPPHVASMNLEGFHGYATLPADWKKVVYHEFGHALGLLHEHQHPTSECGNALRLEDDPEYELTLDGEQKAVSDARGKRPGVLTQLEHAPNFWPRVDAEHNLERLKRSKDLALMDFDPDSIMRYEFAAEWYRDDAPSECRPTGKQITRPSKMDVAMVAQTYQRLMEDDIDSYLRE